MQLRLAALCSVAIGSMVWRLRGIGWLMPQEQMTSKEDASAAAAAGTLLLRDRPSTQKQPTDGCSEEPRLCKQGCRKICCAVAAAAAAASRRFDDEQVC